MCSKPFLGHAAYYHNCSNYTNSFVPDMRHIKDTSYTTIFSLWRQSVLLLERNIIMLCTRWKRYRSMSTRGKWIKLMSKMLKVLKEKYEGKSFSVIIGNRVNGGGLLKHSCIICGRRCNPRASSPIGGAARSHARAAREKRHEGTVHSRVLSRLALHAINGKLATA